MLPLHMAIEHMDEDAVRALLAEGADPNAQEPEFGGFSPLQLAVDIECEDSRYRYDSGEITASPRATITFILIEAGANPDLPDQLGQTARSLAKERLHTEALFLFNEKRADTLTGSQSIVSATS